MPVTRIEDSKGRMNIPAMTTDEKLDEVLAIARATQDLVEKFMDDLSTGKLGGMMGMMGRLMGGGK